MKLGARPRRRLTRKYVAVFAMLVVAALLSSGLTEAYFSYQDNKKALTSIQREKASSAATSIKQWISDVRRQIVDAARTPDATGEKGQEERKLDYLRILERVASAVEVSYLDSSGREQLRISRFEPDAQGSGIDYSTAQKFLVARSKGTYYGPVYFRGGSRPHTIISVAESPPGRGVVAAEIDLQFVDDVILRTRVGSAGYAYAVDSRGRLLAHPDINLVLGRADFSSLPQVRAALQGSAKSGANSVTTGRDQNGRKVLSAFQTIDAPGWHVFVEEPLSVAFAPLASAIKRTALFLVAFLLLAIATSVLLARRMVRPIKSMQAAAARIGAGALDQRIDVSSRDELGVLAEEFNRMAVRLQESYTGLEKKVEERTQELAKALAELDEKSHLLELASQHKTAFLANMSHELRTPLNAIVGFSEVLREGLFGAPNEKQREYLDDIVSSAHHLLALINDILDLSKIEAGRMELAIERFSLREALDRGLNMVREEAVRQGVSLALDVAAGLDVIEADERRVRQVVFNLLSNAVKFTPRGGRIDVISTHTGDEIRVAVHDTGIGIAPGDLERIFEEFQQAGRSEGGTGLGLPLSRRFIELHGGRMFVESEVGVGSTFSFTLPPHQPATAQEPASRRLAAGEAAPATTS